MSRRSGKRIAWAALAAGLALVAGCSTPGSRPAATAASEPVAVPDPDAAGGASVPPVEVPEGVLASYTRALDAMSASDWIEAELELEQLILEYPDYPGPYVNLAILYRRDARSDEAETMLNQALAIAPDHPAANGELGIIHRERGDFEAAEAAYRRALGTDPSYALAHYNLGVLLDLYLRREAEALEHYEAYQSLSAENDPEVARWIVDLRRRLGMPEERSAQIAQETGS